MDSVSGTPAYNTSQNMISGLDLMVPTQQVGRVWRLVLLVQNIPKHLTRYALEIGIHREVRPGHCPQGGVAWYEKTDTEVRCIYFLFKAPTRDPYTESEPQGPCCVFKGNRSGEQWHGT